MTVGDTLELQDGRKLGFCEYGKPDGIPLMLFHGTPGSRIFSQFESAPWVEAFGIRVITPERPGYGLSDPAPGRAIVDWPRDVNALADQLGLDRYHVAGGSGGGPYAMACALHSPDRVLSATLFCSGGPPEIMRLTREMEFGNRLAFFSARYAPLLLKLVLGQSARVARNHPDKFIAAMTAKSSGPERQILEERAARTLVHLQEAYRRGIDGAYRDMLLVSRPWGLNLASVSVPVFLWHGTDDRLVPVTTARALAQMIPGCEAHFIPDVGHQLLGVKEVVMQMAGRMVSVTA